MKKRFCMLIALVMAMLLVGCSGCAGCSACSKAPELDEVYDRVVELIEASKEINTVFYGVGLPVYEIDSDYASYHQLYGDENDDKKGIAYEIVTEYAKFRSEGEIKDAAENVYSADCLATLYSTAFDGYATTDGKNGMVIAKARYDSGSEKFSQLADLETEVTGMRIYDYSTMKIVNPSNAQLFRISIDSWMEDTPDQVENTYLSFALAEDGQWYLDTFT